MKKISNISYPSQFIPQCLAISQDNRYVGVGSTEGKIKVY